MANHLMHFDPFGDLARLDPFRGFEDMLRDFGPRLRSDVPAPIRVDVSETESDYTIKADIPGVKKDDIKVSIEGRQVSISVDVKREQQQGAVYSERFVGHQSRRFSLPTEVDETGASARYVDGTLELTLPKRQGASSRQLTIE